MSEQSAKMLRASKNYIHRKVARNDVLIPVVENAASFNGCIELNSTAAFIWDMLEEPCSADVLTEALMREFSVEQDKAKADVTEFLERLIEHNMVEAV